MLETIFTASAYDCADTLNFVFSDVILLKDFGPWCKDESYCFFDVDLEKGIIKELDKEGKNVLKECKITICPLEQ